MKWPTGREVPFVPSTAVVALLCLSTTLLIRPFVAFAQTNPTASPADRGTVRDSPPPPGDFGPGPGGPMQAEHDARRGPGGFGRPSISLKRFADQRRAYLLQATP